MTQDVIAWSMPFRGEDLGMFDHSKDIQEFGYGNALTVHKAQGSQWPSVVVFDESHVFKYRERAKWAYTAVTRAAEKLALVLG